MSRKTKQCYQDMKQRCLNPKAQQFKNYGARGIKICRRWLESYENFLADMGEKPNDMTLDRINTNGDYEPSNCRWSTIFEQNQNKRSCHYLEFNGEIKPLRVFAREFNIHEATLLHRIKKGISIEEALKTPVNRAKSMAAKAMNKIKHRTAIAAQENGDAHN